MLKLLLPVKDKAIVFPKSSLSESEHFKWWGNKSVLVVAIELCSSFQHEREISQKSIWPIGDQTMTRFFQNNSGWLALHLGHHYSLTSNVSQFYLFQFFCFWIGLILRTNLPLILTSYQRWNLIFYFVTYVLCSDLDRDHVHWIVWQLPVFRERENEKAEVIFSWNISRICRFRRHSCGTTSWQDGTANRQVPGLDVGESLLKGRVMSNHFLGTSSSFKN